MADPDLIAKGAAGRSNLGFGCLGIASLPLDAWLLFSLFGLLVTDT